MTPDLACCRRRLALLAIVWACSLVGLAGCGSSANCDGVSCEFGTCQEGACANPESCETNFDCIPGYGCDEEKVCRSLASCSSDDECATGVCEGGHCVNGESCESDGDCFERTFCAEDNTCQPDPCNTFQCQQGQCKRGTNECVSKSSCTDETEGADCVDGERCLDGSCYAEEAFCEQLDCERGQCDFGEKSCVNADSCQEDDQCVEGSYCNDDGECAEDLCVIDAVDCGSGGVCVPALGECENAEPCSSSDECLDGHWCVEGSCRLEEVACGDTGCPGRQTCEYDDQAMTASCKEAEDCESSLGCTGDRQCAGGVCLAPVDCADDRFEPNDDASEATDFNVVSSALAVPANICGDDTDYFTVDTQALPDFPLRGTLVVTADYARRDAGLGELEMELIDPNGDTVDTATSGVNGKDGGVEIRAAVNAATHGVYTVRIAPVGDISSAGVTYTLSADMVTSNEIDACADVDTITTTQSISADTGDGTSNRLGSSCTSPHNPQPENLYTFELIQTSEVTLSATPSASNRDLDMSIALRSSCELLATEVGCANTGDSCGEVLTRVLPPGTYFVIIEVASGTTGGAYSLTMSTSPVFCSEHDNNCSDADTAQICTGNASFTPKSCSLGCDPRTGTCKTGPGDTCDNAHSITEDSFTETIDWSSYTNQYEFAPGGCVDDRFGDTHTRGSEVVYAVSLDAGYGLSASLEFPTGEFGSLYVTTGCLNPQSSCVAGANEGNVSTETLNYVNDSSQPETVFLIADTAGIGQSSANLDVQIGEVICEPGTFTCDSNDDVQRCNGAGTARVPDSQCGYGCTSGACDDPPNEECGGAIEVVPGTPVTAPIQDFSSNVDAAQSCAGSSSTGPDAFYKVVTTEPEKVVTVEVAANFDAIVYTVNGCGSSSPLCGEGVDDEGSGASEQLDFYAGTPGEYIVVVDTDSSSSSGDFTISAIVQDAQCPAGDLLSCSSTEPDKLEYCSQSALIESHTCSSGSCSGSSCDSPSGDICLEAIATSDGSSHTRNYSTLEPDYAPSTTSCPGMPFSPLGPEAVYRLDLLAGQTVTADLSSSSVDMSLYIVSACDEIDSRCLVGSDLCCGGTTESVDYTASTDETVYIMADAFRDTVTTNSGSYTLDVTVTP